LPLFNGRHIERIVVLTGAGVSAESGLATFRDAGGLWENHDPMTLATPEAFQRNPGLVYRFYNDRRRQLQAVAPNAAHRAIARLQREFPGEVFLVTQNVDDLHERGGSGQVCHMHGELRSMLCTACGRRARADGDFDASTPCPGCGGVGSLRPDVVWFGELPYHMEVIELQLADCDLFVAVGTSGVVYPAAGFVQQARLYGASTVEVNRETSEVTGLFHLQRRGPATAEMAGLVDELLGGAGAPPR
jgi:NAD-dependent deacetylase